MDRVTHQAAVKAVNAALAWGACIGFLMGACAVGLLVTAI